MKRMMFCLCALALSLSFAGCSKSIDKAIQETSAVSDNAIAMENADLTQSEKCVLIAQKAIDNFNSKKFDELSALFSDSLRAKVSNGDWGVAYDAIVDKGGKYVEKMNYSVVYKHNAPVVEYVVRHEKLVYWYLISFDNRGNIVGFLLPNAEKVNKWTNDSHAIYDSESYIEAFRRKDWDYIRSKSTDLLASVLTNEFLEKAYGLVMTDLGGYVSLVSRNDEKKGGTRVVHHVNNHRNGEFVADITFLSDGKVDKFSVKPPKINKNSNSAAPSASESEADPFAPVVNDVFAEEAVKVIGSEKYPLDGLLTMPKNVTKPPVVILIHGSGPGDMNESFLKSYPFMDIAHGLAANGIATLRYNKRTMAYGSVMTQEEALIEFEYMDDLNAAIKLMASDERIGKIFVLGHSLGGSLIPAISVSHPELAGVISVAGSMRSLDVVAIEQLQAQLEFARANYSGEELKTAEDMVIPVMDELKQVREINDETPDDRILFYVPVRYWRSLNKLLNTEYVEQMKHPFFILQGGDDFQVYPDRDYKLWQEIACSRDNVTCKLYPKLTHFMAPSLGFGDARDYMETFHVSNEVISDIAKFVLAN